MRNHQKIKREALKNAVLNSALRSEPDESLQQMFITFVDEQTEWHIILLKFFESPETSLKAYGVTISEISMGGLNTVLEKVFPELKEKKSFYNLVWKDLHIRGLVNTENLQTSMSPSGLVAKRTTEIGDRFLKFISSPKT